MSNHPPLNPEALTVAGQVVFKNVLGFDKTKAWAVAKRAVSAYLAVAEPERDDERITAWHEVAAHPAFQECYNRERTLLESMLQRLTELHTADQPAVNSAEELVTTPAGRALADAAFNEGLSAGIMACNDSLDGEPFVKPVSPYRPEVDG